MSYGSIGCTYHKLKYSSPNRSKQKTQKQEQHKRAYLSKMEVWEKNKSEEWAKSRHTHTHTHRGPEIHTHTGTHTSTHTTLHYTLLDKTTVDSISWR